MSAPAKLSLALLLPALLTLLGCRSVASNISREIHLNLGIEPATIDPALATDPGSQQIARMLFLSLVDTSAATGAPEHSFAISWAVSGDGLIWEFKLRDDAFWVKYNPSFDRVDKLRPVIAQDVVYSVRRVFDPRLGSGFGSLFAPMIRGAQELLSADPKSSPAAFERLFSNLGVQTVDDTTIRFTLTHPASYFPSIVSVWLVRTQPREAVESGGPDWTEPGTVWTNGPFVLERWSHNREIFLKKNPYWYDASKMALDRIHFSMIADTATALDQYKSGNLDSLDPYGNLSGNDADSLKEDPILAKQLQSVPSLCTHYYGFNVTKPPFDDVRVRKAFIAGTDREAIVGSNVHLGEPARWFTRPGIFASLDVSDTLGIPYNPTQARDYIRQAGYDKKKMPNLTLGVNTDDIHQRIADNIVQMWKTNLGVDVRVGPLDWKSYIQTLRDDPPQIFRLGWCGYYPDPANFGASVFQSNSPDNFTRWSSPQFDQIILAAARETDTAKRRGLYRSAEKILVEDNAIILPLWWSTRATLSRPNLKRTFAVTDGYERLETWSLQ
jgi:oligopeptide transport system substrate-binding protein